MEQRGLYVSYDKIPRWLAVDACDWNAKSMEDAPHSSTQPKGLCILLHACRHRWMAGILSPVAWGLRASPGLVWLQRKGTFSSWWWHWNEQGSSRPAWAWYHMASALQKWRLCPGRTEEGSKRESDHWIKGEQITRLCNAPILHFPSEEP